MKVTIKSGDCPSYLTIGKVYDALNISEYGCNIVDDNHDVINILFEDCAFLRGGSWEIVGE